MVPLSESCLGCLGKLRSNDAVHGRRPDPKSKQDSFHLIKMTRYNVVASNEMQDNEKMTN